MVRSLVVALATSCLGVAALLTPAAAQSAFYGATAAEIAGAPGTLIRQEPMPAAPAGASAFRVLYRSTGLSGEPIAVSGVIFVPTAAAPATGRPIVAWAHPTSGVATRCAPSLATFLDLQIQGLGALIEHGYIVAATDYPGLGTAGTHPYLIGDSEGRAVLDSVRAARSLPGSDPSSHYAVWGHSQGGQAALFAGLLAHSYAPELTLAGIAVAAPATELITLLEDDINTAGGENLTAMTLWSWSRLFNESLADVVKPQAVAPMDTLANECIESLVDLLERRGPSRTLSEGFLAVTDLPNLEPWHARLVANTPGPLPAAIPVFIAQGEADTLVRPSVTQNYASELCKGGSRVELMTMPGVNHGFAARDSATAAVAWIAGRFAGGAAPSTC